MTEYLLKIFTAVLPHKPPSASKFATDLQESTMIMLNQPGKVGPQVRSSWSAPSGRMDADGLPAPCRHCKSLLLASYL